MKQDTKVNIAIAIGICVEVLLLTTIWWIG